MKKLIVFCLLLSQVFIGNAQTPETTTNQLLTDFIKSKSGVGIAAGYAINGKVEWESAEGISDKKKNTPFKIETSTRIASIAKPMTAIAVLQLYEAGKIDLDAQIQDYAPQFPVKKEGAITVRHLLQHASGIGAYQSNKEANNKKNYPTLTAAAQSFQDRDLIDVPGKAFNYSSYGYVVLGMVIEGASGMTYEAYMQKNIWGKLGMNETGIEKSEVDYPNKAKDYHRNNKGKIKKAKCVDLSNRVPGGGIYSNVPDLLKFGNAVLNHTLIKESTFQMMITDSGLKKEGNPYGLGWYLYGKDKDKDIVNVLGHTGAQLGCSSFLFLLPEQGISVIVVSNTSGALQEVSNIAITLIGLAGDAEKLKN